MKRNQSLDALRGFAILTMILSGSIAYGDVLPAWMYHAQVPPPEHKFIPTIPGITWVDLVFPFFLFSMGAAIPLSLSKQEREGSGFLYVFLIAGRRYLLLAFFALFTEHMKAWVIQSNPGSNAYLLSMLGFLLLCIQFYDYKRTGHKRLWLMLRIAAFIIAIALLYLLPFGGKGFQLSKVDIIILVLANMAFFGTIAWWLTRRQVWVRVGILPFIMAVFLGSKVAGSWNEALYNFTPLPWLYKFYYLKYLFIIIPGTVAGEWLLKDIQKPALDTTFSIQDFLCGLLAFGMVWCNVALLYSRLLVLNLFLTVFLGLAIWYFISKRSDQNLMGKFWRAGFYLLLLGLFFEAYENGIKKDISTYSYYFVTSGLAFFMLIGFNGLQFGRWGRAITHFLSLNGRNPMVAYVAGSLLLTPVLHLSGMIALFEKLNSNAWLGFFKGILFTGIISLITIFFTKRKWFWKT